MLRNWGQEQNLSDNKYRDRLWRLQRITLPTSVEIILLQQYYLLVTHILLLDVLPKVLILALLVSPWFSTLALVSSETCLFFVFHLHIQAHCLPAPLITVCCFFSWVSPQPMMPDLSKLSWGNALSTTHTQTQHERHGKWAKSLLVPHTHMPKSSHIVCWNHSLYSPLYFCYSLLSLFSFQGKIFPAYLNRCM